MSIDEKLFSSRTRNFFRSPYDSNVDWLVNALLAIIAVRILLVPLDIVGAAGSHPLDPGYAVNAVAQCFEWLSGATLVAIVALGALLWSQMSKCESSTANQEIAARRLRRQSSLMLWIGYTGILSTLIFGVSNGVVLSQSSNSFEGSGGDGARLLAEVLKSVVTALVLGVGLTAFSRHREKTLGKRVSRSTSSSVRNEFP